MGNKTHWWELIGKIQCYSSFFPAVRGRIRKVVVTLQRKSYGYNLLKTEV